MYRKLKFMPYANAHVYDQNEFDIPVVELWSYHTCVVRVIRGHWVQCSGLYSMTTRKHISAFMREFFPELEGKGFQLCKQIAGKGVEMDVRTGEIRPYLDGGHETWK